METYLIAVDTSKNYFQVRAVTRSGACVFEKKLGRQAFKEFVVNHPKSIIAIEVGQGAHYWGRFFSEHGHEAKLIPAAFVKPFVKSQKNDRADAEGIAEAALRPHMRFVNVKTSAQQDLQNLHRVRERLVRQKTSLGNQLRGLLAEYGIIFPQGARNIAQLPAILETYRESFSELAMVTFKDLYEEYRANLLHLKELNSRIERVQAQDETVKRLMTIPGIGVLTATAILATAIDPKQCKNGRAFAASLGLVPRQFSTGGKTTLGGITKRGSPYIRKLLVHGARAVLIRSGQKTDARSIWLRKLAAGKGIRKLPLLSLIKTLALSGNYS